MNRGLRWGLVVSVVLSAAALWLDEPAGIVAAVSPRLTTPDSVSSGIPPGTSHSSANRNTPPREPLPPALPSPNLASAQRDLFAPVIPRAASAPAIVMPPPVMPVPQPPTNVAPASPSTPEVQYRYIGRLKTPRGESLFYIGSGDTVMPVKQGDSLEPGFVVERIDPDGIRLLYPPTQQHVVIPIPPDQTL